MPDELQTGTGVDTGQSAFGNLPDAAPADTDGQPEVNASKTATKQTTDGAAPATDKGTAATGTDTEETFFDPRDIADKPELMAAYKQMQAAFTKKTQAIKEHRNKVEAYDAFYKNPVESMQRMASQLGYKLTRAEAQAMVDQQQGGQQRTDQNWEPQTWDEVMERAEQRAYNRIMQELNPALGELQSMKRNTLEQRLDNAYPEWRQYEDDLIGIVNEHPTLASPEKIDQLMKLAIPQEVWESRAMQAAMKRIKAQGANAQVSGGSTTTRQADDISTKQAKSFDEAVQIARQRLAADGIHR